MVIMWRDNRTHQMEQDTYEWSPVCLDRRSKRLQDRRAYEEKDADITGLFDESDATGPTGASGDTPVARVVVPYRQQETTDPLPRVLPGETGGEGGDGGAGGIYTDPNDLPPFPEELFLLTFLEKDKGPQELQKVSRGTPTGSTGGPLVILL